MLATFSGNSNVRRWKCTKWWLWCYWKKLGSSLGLAYTVSSFFSFLTGWGQTDRQTDRQTFLFICLLLAAALQALCRSHFFGCCLLNSWCVSNVYVIECCDELSLLAHLACNCPLINVIFQSFVSFGDVCSLLSSSNLSTFWVTIKCRISKFFLKCNFWNLKMFLNAVY